MENSDFIRDHKNFLHIFVMCFTQKKKDVVAYLSS